MYAYVALTVYGEIVPADLFETAVKDFRVAQRVFYSPSGRKRALFGRVEELLRPFSFYKSMSTAPSRLPKASSTTVPARRGRTVHGRHEHRKLLGSLR